ncbi:phytoene desaturase family protein [Streptomyces sp. BBFR2]|uniref:phytoene desaturase family protein n=1 Tax=Streptomyces sp. BBFR2 TaxID=3372854 RepID=UPI0037D9DA84
MTARNAPRVIIIGAGISGMAAGCYARMSGLDTLILEKHVLPGGCCTAWSRDGYLFDYCIEWLSGTAPGTAAHQVWQELGALDGKTVTHFDRFNHVVDEDGRGVSFYNDPDRLERHLLALSPADARPIRAFCRDLRRFATLDLHPLTPPPLRTVREKARMARTVLPAFRLLWRTAATPMDRFADRFQDPLLRRAFRHIFFQDTGFPMLPYLFGMAAAHTGNGGFPQGGSLGLSRSIERRYTSLGGEIRYRSRVERVLVEDGRATGVQLKDGTRHEADHTIAACDGLTTVHRLLDGRYTGPRIDRLYQDVLHRPGTVFPAMVSVFLGVDGDFCAREPHSTTHLLPADQAARLPGALQNSLVVQVRSRYSDGFAPPGRTVLHCTYFSDYDSWKSLRRTDRRAYRARKEQAAAFVRDFLERRHPGIGARTDVVEVATPVTTERYTGNRQGSVLGWMAFSEADDLVAEVVNRDRLRLPGLRGFSLAGQWAGMGGLIRAATTGRYAVQYLCDELGTEFRATPSGGGPPWHPSMLGHLPQLDPRPRRTTARRPV